MDYSRLDAGLVFLWEMICSAEESVFFFEKFFTSFLIVLTKNHKIMQRDFDQWPYYKIMKGIILSFAQ